MKFVCLYVCVCECLLQNNNHKRKHKNITNRGSAFKPGASEIPYYCTSICARSWSNWRASSVDFKPKKQMSLYILKSRLQDAQPQSKRAGKKDKIKNLNRLEAHPLSPPNCTLFCWGVLSLFRSVSTDPRFFLCKRHVQNFRRAQIVRFVSFTSKYVVKSVKET